MVVSPGAADALARPCRQARVRSFRFRFGSSRCSLGVGASRVRDISSRPKHAPCIIFIDEIGMFGHRGAGWVVVRRTEQTLNQLLVEMDAEGGEA